MIMARNFDHSLERGDDTYVVQQFYPKQAEVAPSPPTLEVIRGNLRDTAKGYESQFSEKRPCLMTKVLPIFQVWVRIFCLLRKKR